MVVLLSTDDLRPRVAGPEVARASNGSEPAAPGDHIQAIASSTGGKDLSRLVLSLLAAPEVGRLTLERDCWRLMVSR
jgi:hypothetical protein